MLRYEISIDGSIQQDLGFALTPLQDIRAVWFLTSPTFSLQGVANELTLLLLNRDFHRADFRFGENEVFHIEEDKPIDIHYVTEDRHLYLRFTLRVREVGEQRYKEGYRLSIQEKASKEDSSGTENAQRHYEIDIDNGGVIYLEALKQYLLIDGVYPSRDMITVIFGPAPGVGKVYEISETKPGGFKYHNTGGAYENFYDECQELSLSIEEKEQ